MAVWCLTIFTIIVDVWVVVWAWISFLPYALDSSLGGDWSQSQWFIYYAVGQALLHLCDAFVIIFSSVLFLKATLGIYFAARISYTANPPSSPRKI